MKMSKEAKITGAGLAFAGVMAAGCSFEGRPAMPEDRSDASDAPQAESTFMFPQIPGVVAHTEDRRGNPIGVRVYAGPNTNEVRGRALGEGEGLNLVCVQTGRDLIDENVPPDQSKERGDQWYALVTTFDPEQQRWVNTSYVDVIGSTAVPQCTDIGIPVK